MQTDNISEKLNRVFEELAQGAQEDAKRPRKSTGFPSLDKITTGLVDGDLIVIAGRPAMGKTALAHIIANELGVNMKVTSGPILDKPGDLAGLLTSLEEGDVLFILPAT